jgi:hypothetical protein
MSFGESVFSAGFIQKTIKVDLDVRLNHDYSQDKQLSKVPEDNTPKRRAIGRQVGLAGPTLRPADLGPHLSASTSVRRFSTSLRIASTLFI